MPKYESSLFMNYTIENFADVIHGYNNIPQCSPPDTVFICAAHPNQLNKRNKNH